MKDRIEELEYRLEKQKETSACRNSQIATLQKRVKELEADQKELIDFYEATTFNKWSER